MAGEIMSAERPEAGEPARDADRRKATGYSLVLPPPWRRIPLRGGTKTAIRKILDDAFRGLPRDRIAPYRRQAEEQLAQVVSQARKAGGTELYLPVGLRGGNMITASFVVAELPLDFPAGADPAMVAAALADVEPGTETITVSGAPGTRFERCAGADPAAGADFGSRRVDYLLSIPGNPTRWLSFAFSTLGGGDPDDDFAKLLVKLFDAIMSTLRWTRPSGTGPGRADDVEK
jgi:hypothetical protein